MQQNRRKVCASIATGGLLGLAGCLGFGDDPSEEPRETSTGNETEESDEPTPNELARLILGGSTRDIVDVFKWLNAEYSSARNKYVQNIETVTSDIDSVIEETNASGEVSSDQITALEQSFSLNVFDTGEELFGAVYNDHYDFRAAYAYYANDFERYMEANEVQLLIEDLSELKTRLTTQSTPSTITDRYPSTKIYGDVYDLFVKAGDNIQPRVFEFRNTYSSSNNRIALPSSEEENNPEIEPDQYRDDAQFNSKLDNSFIDESRVFSAPEDRISESYIRITEYNSANVFDLRDEYSNNVYIQEYPDTSTTQSAFESIRDAATQNGTETRGDAVWHQLYRTNEDETVYADVTVAGEYIICIGISTTIWDERSQYGIGNSEPEHPWDHIYRDTWLIQEQPDDGEANVDENSDGLF